MNVGYGFGDWIALTLKATSFRRMRSVPMICPRLERSYTPSMGVDHEFRVCFLHRKFFGGQRLAIKFRKGRSHKSGPLRLHFRSSIDKPDSVTGKSQKRPLAKYRFCAYPKSCLVDRLWVPITVFPPMSTMRACLALKTQDLQ